MLRTTFYVLGFSTFLVTIHSNRQFASNADNFKLISSILQTEYYDGLTMVAVYSCQASRRASVSFIKQQSSNGYSSLIMQHFHGAFTDFKAPERTFTVLDISCNFAKFLIEKANEYRRFGVAYKWLLLEDTWDQNMGNFLVENFTNVDILADSDVSYARRSREAPRNDLEYKLIKIYKRKANSSIISEDFGEFSGGIFQVDKTFVKIASNRRKNLGTITMNNCNVVTHNETFQHLLDKRAKHIDTLTKVNYIFMLHLGDMLNVTMNFSFVETWGYRGNDSHWTGMIGELTRGRSVIAGTPLFVTSDRIPIIDYVAMTTPTRSKFVFRQPKLSYIANVYTLPFNTGVWLASVACVVITGLGLYIGVKWDWYKRRNYVSNTHFVNTDELQDDPVDVAFVAFAAVCQQGSNAIPSSITGRIVTIFMYTSLMFLYTSYSANIVALLQSSSTSIQTLEDLLKSRLEVGVDDTVYNRFYFPNASEPIRRALYLQKVAPPGEKQRYFPIEEGVRRLRQGLFAFHMEAGAGYKIVGETFLEDEKCGLHEIQFLQVPDPWLAVQKNSSFREIIKVGLRKLHESGLQNREVSLLYTKKPMCMSRGSSFMGVAIVDCYPAALVFAVGITIAVGVFVLELFAHQFADCQRRFVCPRLRRKRAQLQ